MEILKKEQKQKTPVGNQIRPKKIKGLLNLIKKKIGNNIWGSFGVKRKISIIKTACLYNHLNAAETDKCRGLLRQVSLSTRLIETELKNIENEMNKIRI